MGLQREIVGGLLLTADLHQVRAAGAILAPLQDALAHTGCRSASRARRCVQAVGGRVTDWLDSRADPLPTAARDTLRGLVAGAPPDRLPRQLVHFDFRSATILYGHGEVAAIIDFEEAQYDHRLVEPARVVVLLGTRHHNGGRPRFAQSSSPATSSERPLTPAEAGWLDILLLWQALAMVPPGDPTGWGPSALRQL